ncbi:hypothetical protein EYR36_000609 [Pleurotus pulmonarius]|nr:hypothetical protein EYR36_004776 [Pleurotus pulmonarius]KAF4578802.1 hypothetical protein EYR36_000609 [Pleurotus pulmonarius]
MLERHDSKDVAIFWDYENCHGPSAVSGYDVVRSIRNVAHKFGSVKLFKAYLELSEQPISPRVSHLLSELQSSGVSLTNCPHNGRKDVADQMMIVDMLTYAIDRPAPATIILISGDRDFAYAASVLRLRRYSVVVASLTNPGAHPSLKAQANTTLDWNADIMDKVGEEYCHWAKRDEPMPTEEISRPTWVRQRSSTVSTATEILLAPSVHKAENKPSGPIRHKRDNSTNYRNLAVNVDKSTQTHGSLVHAPCSCSATLVPEHFKKEAELLDTRSLREHKIKDVHVLSTPHAPSSGKDNFRKIPLALPPGSMDRKEEASLSNQTDAFLVTDNPQSVAEAASEGTKEEAASLDDFPLPVTMSQRVEAFKKMVVLLREQEQCRTLRSALACELVSAGVVAQAGARDFQDYLYLAESFGLIEQGGSKAEAWVSLHPEWQDSDEYENITSQSLAQPSTNANEPITREAVVVDDTPMFTPQSTPVSLASWCDMAGCRDGPLLDVGPAEQMNSTDTTNKDNAAPMANSAFQLSAQAPPFVPPIPLQGRSAEAPPATTPGISIPPYFILLIEILLRYSEEGVFMMSRSKVAVELMATNKLIYQQAGVTRFGEYAALAQRYGIVELGASEGGGDAWISLSLPFASDCPSPSTASPDILSPPMVQRSLALPGPSSSNFRRPAPEPTRPKVASHFWPLIEILNEHRMRGMPRPLRSVVAQELQRQNVYNRAGVTKFREYIALAESAEIVTLGGTEGRDWVSFDSGWLQSYG